MKKLLLLVLLLPSIAYGQGWQIPPPAGTPRAYPTPGTPMNRANVDIYGNQQVVAVSGGGSGLSQSVIPVSDNVGLNGLPTAGVGYHNVSTVTATTGSTTTVIAITGIESSAKVGDAVQALANTTTTANRRNWSIITTVATNAITVSPAFTTAPVNGDTFSLLRPVPLMLNNFAGATTTLPVNIDSTGQPSNTTGILKLENGVAADGDAGVAAWSVRNEGAADFGNSNLDYNPFATTRAGAAYSIMSTSFGGATPGKEVAADEDSAFAASDAGVKVLGQAVSAISQLVGTTGDVAPPSMDLGNRVVTTNAPAGETWQGCGTATASTADVAIKAAVASNRIYVTSITCSSSSATTATNINFKDGSTVIAVGGTNQMATTSAGTFTATFPTPLRGTVNTALNFNTAVSTSSVICCGAGYISTI